MKNGIALIAALLFAGSILAPFAAGAQTAPWSRLQILTQTAAGTSFSGTATITTVAHGASLTGIPTGTNLVTYDSSFTTDTRTVTFYQGAFSVTAYKPGYTFSYSPECSGTSAGGILPTCVVTAQSTTNNFGTLVVTVNAVSGAGTPIKPEQFHLTVSGNNPYPSSFSGSAYGTYISMGTGSYAVSAPSYLGYTATLSGECAGVMSGGDTRSCTITYRDQYGGCVPGTSCLPLNQLSCVAQAPTVPTGGTAQLRALGGIGNYTWVVDGRTYYNNSPILTVRLDTPGIHGVTVTSGTMTAVCTVLADGPVPPPAGISIPGTGIYLYPTLPNTGFEPVDWVGLLLAVLAVLAALFYPHALKRFSTN